MSNTSPSPRPSQHHLDRWLSEGPTRRHQIKGFLQWTSQTKLTAPLYAPSRLDQRQGIELADDERLGLIVWLLHDDDLELRTRVAGLLIFLYGQPLTRVTRIRVEHIDRHDEHTSIKLGRDKLTLPAPIDQLVEQLADAPEGSTFHDPNGGGWLFPGQVAGAPITAERLRRRLIQQLGPLPIRPGRHSAITALLRTTPAPVLADLLGFSQNRAHRWARLAGLDYANYVAARQSAQPQS